MTTLIKRKLEYADRFALQQADQAIRKDVIRALVELITNSNDSYQRLEDAGQSPNGLIVIEIQRRHNDSILRIRDYAEGMNGEQMDKNVGTYGGATSGFREGRSVRGLWGRGLKDAVYGLGHGRVLSIQDNQFHRCMLSIKDGVPTFELDQPVHASRTIRAQYDIRSGNGTIIEIVVSRDDVRFPQFDNIRRYSQRHFELRSIMSNPKRRIVLMELDARGKTKQEMQLSYIPPTGVQVLDTSFGVPNFPAVARLEVYRADVPLSTPAEEGDYADGGLLVISKRVVLGLTLLKFENNEYATRFYGRITCDYLHELLKKEPPEPVLTATRDGIEWKHPFTKALRALVEEHLEPLVEEEKRRARAEERSAINKKLQQKLNFALKELNSIASEELGKAGEIPGDKLGKGKKEPSVPPSGFGFEPDYVYVQTGKTSSLTLRARIPEKVAGGSLITIESESPEVLVLTPQVVIEPLTDYPNIGQAQVLVEGRQVGAETIIWARLDRLEAAAFVKVISKKEPPKDGTDLEMHRGGIFRGYRFDKTAEPKQRAYFEQATSTVVIATRAPSVVSYFDDEGKGIDSAQGQVMLAELISEVVCREIARRGVISGRYLAPEGGAADAIQREYIALQNKHTHRIHACLVDPEYRRDGNDGPKRKGRPKVGEN